MKARSGELAKSEEWPVVQAKAQSITEKILKDPSDLKSKLLTAQLYMQEARITGEHPYYYPATLTLLNDVLSHDANNFEALAYKASVELSLHHFAECIGYRYQSKKTSTHRTDLFSGCCVMPMLNWATITKLLNVGRNAITPSGLEAYSRASYLREIYGNNEAAIQAVMGMSYNTWVTLGLKRHHGQVTTLGIPYVNTGDL